MTGGEQYLFSQECDRRFGEGSWDELMRMRHLIHKISLADYRDLIEHYKAEVKAMKKEKGL